MSSNQSKITNFYEGYTQRTGEDNRANASRSDALEFHYTKKAMLPYVDKNTRILEVGCGTGYYGLFFADKCKDYLGIDLFPHHIEIFQDKIEKNALKNLSCQVGDATNLCGIESDCYDVVFCFGPMYHLPPLERERVFVECKRVCKADGIIAFAYINKIGVYVGACVHDHGREFYPSKKANETVLNGTDDLKPDIFFFTMPEEMEALAAKYDLTKIKNMGTDFFITQSVVNNMNDEKFALYMELADQMVNYESCTGMSNHALLICKNN